MSAADVVNRFEAALRLAGFRGDASPDFAARAAFSTDNSVYQLVPDLVVAPADAEDVQTLMRILEEPPFASMAITARGGGTGTNGQSLNTGVIIDFRRHMNRILDMDLENGWIDVEPGIVLDDLNEQVARHGVFFSPTTSSSNRCTIGGMASTDASGKGSRVYGKTADNMLGLDLVLPGGRLLQSGAPTPRWAEPMLETVAVACDAGRPALLSRVPRLSRRFSGLDLERARPDSGTLEWWRLLIGAEGTLGVMTRLRLKLTPKPKATRLGVIAFKDFFDTLDATTRLLEAEPLAVEVMDGWVQKLADDAGLLDALPPELRTGEGCVYAFVEFAGNDEDALRERLDACLRLAEGLSGFRAAYAASDPAEIAQLWSVRAAAVGLLGAEEGRRRPVSFVEDCVVPPPNLSAFVRDFAAILDRHGVTYGMYGHADVGCLHVRPALDIDSADDRLRYKEISDAVFAAAVRHGGIFWGEHGKGIRGDYLEEFVGPEAFDAFRRIKTAFDPAHRLNPGKLSVAKSERYAIAQTPFRQAHTRDDDPYEKAYACNGNALCLSYAAKTPMCPSFKVSGDLRHSPKGRAEALRALETEEREGRATSRMREDVFDAMDGCLGCKSCAGSCPTHVDIPEMRSHFLQRYYGHRKRPLADHLVVALERSAPMVCRLRAPARLAAGTPLYAALGRALGFVDLPRPAEGRHLDGVPVVKPHDLAGMRGENAVLLVQDAYTSMFDTAAIADIADGLRSLGYEPGLLDVGPGGKAAHVKGKRTEFRRLADRLTGRLQSAARAGVPMIGLDPAFIYMLRSEYPKSGVSNVPSVLSAEEFLAAETARGRLARRGHGGGEPLTIFLHCTEKVLRPSAAGDWKRVFDRLGLPVRIAATGCCGMSGLFGHERRHADWSRKLFDLSWRDPTQDGGPIGVTGFSCRCQVERFAGRTARHPLAHVADAVRR